MLKLFHRLNKKFCSFVPSYDPVEQNDVVQLKNFIVDSKKLLVITGAGVSTESGLPDYRSEKVGLYARHNDKVPYVPVLYQNFVKDASLRQRYWLKNYLGWPKLNSIQPNSTHLTLSQMELKGKLHYLITQNVDNLHKKAKSVKLIELHGTAFKVICLNCDYSIERNSFQEILFKYNPKVEIEVLSLKPDGDVEIKEAEPMFHVPECPDCGGILKPDIVFFGENVPKNRVEKVNNLIQESDSLLVLGSTLTTYSSYRIALKFHELNKPIAVVTIGPTRIDKITNFKIKTRCGGILPLAFNEIDAENHSHSLKQ